MLALCPGLSQWSTKLTAPVLITAIVKKSPLKISPNPHTQSWLSKNFRDMAEGAPSEAVSTTTIITAFFRTMPKSMKILTASSIIAIRLDRAAKNRARKKTEAKMAPPGICVNN